MFAISEFDIIMNAIENKMLELVPAAATSTLCSSYVSGNGLRMTVKFRLGSIMSLRIVSWIFAEYAATASWEVAFTRVITEYWDLSDCNW